MRGSAAARWSFALLASILLGWVFARAALGIERIGVNALVAALAGGLAGLYFAVGSSRAAPASAAQPEAGESGSGPRPVRLDVLCGPLGLKDVVETGGVQWAVRIIPDRFTVPGYAVLAILLQNAFNTPRSVKIHVVRGPVTVEDPPTVGLRAGESGILRIPVFLPLSLKQGSYPWEIQIGAASPRGEGERLIDRRSSRSTFAASVRVVGAHAEAPLNLWAFDWNGFQSMHAEGQSSPDLDPWRVLEGLWNRQPEERKAG